MKNLILLCFLVVAVVGVAIQPVPDQSNLIHYLEVSVHELIIHSIVNFKSIQLVALFSQRT